MIKKFLFSLFLFSWVLPKLSHTQSAIISLTIPPGSRANAMGSAHTAVTDDFLALHFNPAGIARLQKGSAGYYHNNKFRFYGKHPITFAGAVYAIKKGAVGVAFHNFYFNEFMGQQLNSYERSFQFTYARQINSHILLGGSVKLVRNKIGGGRNSPDFTANAWGLDLGILVQNIFPHWTYIRQNGSFPGQFRKFDRKNNFRGLSLGLALLNTGPDKLTYIDENQGEPLPQTLRLGVAFNAVDTDEVSVLLAFDLEKMLVERQKNFVVGWFTAWDNGFDALRFGAEVEVFHVFAFRFGREEILNFGVSESVGEWTFGFGLGPEWARLNLVRRSFPIVPNNEKWVVDFTLSY